MHVPGFIWTAIIAAVTVLLQGLLAGAETSLNSLYAPVIVAGIGAVLRWWEVYAAKEPPDFVSREIEGGTLEAAEEVSPSRFSQWLWGG